MSNNQSSESFDEVKAQETAESEALVEHLVERAPWWLSSVHTSFCTCYACELVYI